MALADKLRERLLEFRLPALLLAAGAALVLSLLRLGPSLRTVVSFFWPLLLSTALFLGAVLVLRVVSPPQAVSPGDRAGEELMDYVAGPVPVEDREQGEEVSGEGTAAVAGQQGVEEAAAEGKNSQ